MKGHKKTSQHLQKYTVFHLCIVSKDKGIYCAADEHLWPGGGTCIALVMNALVMEMKEFKTRV